MKTIFARQLLLLFLLIAMINPLQAQQSYQTPPPVMADLVNAPQTPAVSVNSTGDWLLLMERPGYPSIEVLAQPELRLAGIRINPRTNGASRTTHYTKLTLQRLDGQVGGTPLGGTPREFSVQGLPEEPRSGETRSGETRIENVSWSPDGRRIAFTLTQPEGISLWTASTSDSLQNAAQAQPLTEAVLNDAIPGNPYAWADAQTILYKAVPASRGEIPQQLLIPTGPMIQQSDGKKAPARTYQDLLQNPHDQALFDYYATAQLMSVEVETRQTQTLGEPGVMVEMEPSPDGTYIMVAALHKPYSYLVPLYRFPTKVEVWDRAGQVVQTIADIPLAENIPIGFSAVREGPRSFTWRADQPATLYWIEAQDGGDPNQEADIRDQLFYWKAPFEGQKQASIPLKLRYNGLTWGNDSLAIVDEWWWDNRKVITSAFDPDGGEATKKVLFDRSFEDRYNDPGHFDTHANAYGRQVLLTDESGKTLYLLGQGASPEGNRPFVDDFDMATSEKNRLWRSEAPYYELPIQIVDLTEKTLLTRRESKEDPPNFYLRNLTTDQLTALTDFPHPYPQLKGIEKQVIQYEREDGVALQGDLYLPKDFEEGDAPLPALLWAYPNEFKSADAASQVKGSPYEFIRIGWYSPLFWVTQGYAILDNPSMPVVGEGDKEPNDTFVKQLVANGKAAIDKLVAMGVADSSRVAIGGHSYGAFMTANLLAHSDLFAAGIARSGAYNRTLTPFGFQAEERTYWEAPEVYYQMSPFMHADKINEPLLMIHGEADNNSGTFPLQSERLYNAIKGMGGTTRLVMLPYESHGYQGKESVLHMLWEMDQWLNKYVKNKEEASAKQTGEE